MEMNPMQCDAEFLLALKFLSCSYRLGKRILFVNCVKTRGKQGFFFFSSESLFCIVTSILVLC